MGQLALKRPPVKASAKQLFLNFGSCPNVKVDFAGSTYEELVEAIKQQAPSDHECFSTNQEIASLQIFSEQLDEYVELTPEKISTVEDSSKISVIMKVSVLDYEFNLVR